MKLMTFLILYLFSFSARGQLHCRVMDLIARNRAEIDEANRTIGRHLERVRVLREAQTTTYLPLRAKNQELIAFIDSTEARRERDLETLKLVKALLEKSTQVSASLSELDGLIGQNLEIRADLPLSAHFETALSSVQLPEAERAQLEELSNILKRQEAADSTWLSQERQLIREIGAPNSGLIESLIGRLNSSLYEGRFATEDARRKRASTEAEIAQLERTIQESDREITSLEAQIAATAELRNTIARQLAEREAIARNCEEKYMPYESTRY